MHCELGVQYGKDVIEYQFSQPISAPVDTHLHSLTDGSKTSLMSSFTSPRLGEMILQGISFRAISN